MGNLDKTRSEISAESPTEEQRSILLKGLGRNLSWLLCWDWYLFQHIIITCCWVLNHVLLICKNIVMLSIRFTFLLLTSVEDKHPSRELEFLIVPWKRAVALLKPNGNPLVLGASRDKCRFIPAFKTDIAQKSLLNQKLDRLFYLW